MTVDLDALRRRAGAAAVAAGEGERRACAVDLWPQALGWSAEEAGRHLPAAVVRPRSEEEAAACLAWASETGGRVVVRGAGSGVVGAAIPDPDCVLLDLSGLAGACEVVEGTEPAARVGAGWRLGALEAELGRRGWSLRHFPQSFHDASVGGSIAHDGFGQLSTRYGGIRRQVRGLRVAAPDGSARAQAPEAHLGAEGTLGVITEATLLIRRLPPTRRYLAWRFGGLAETAGFARALAAASPPPSVLRAYSPVDRLVHGFGHGSGASSKGRAALERWLLGRAGWLHALAPLAGRRWTLLAVYEEEEPFGGAPPEAARLAPPSDDAPSRLWWERRYQPDAGRLRRVFANGCFADTADLWGPYERLASLERAATAAAAPWAFAFAHLSHFDPLGACLYVTLAGTGGPERHAQAWRSVMSACVAGGGCVNHHHGVGRAKRPWLANALTTERLSAWRAAKGAADPRGVLNPGLLCP